MGNITMGQQELKTYGLGMDVIKGKLAIVDYALQIGKSYRQAERIINRIKHEDTKGVLHGNTGREPHNKTPLETELMIIDLLKISMKTSTSRTSMRKQNSIRTCISPIIYS
jgi:hypothetical protein